MANFTIVTQYPDVQVVGGSTTQDVQVIGAVTATSSIYFETRIPRVSATTAAILAKVSTLADEYESFASYPGVADVVWSQEPNNAGLLVDTVVIYVTSTSGNSTGVVSFPITLLPYIVLGKAIADLRAALDNTEAG